MPTWRRGGTPFKPCWPWRLSDDTARLYDMTALPSISTLRERRRVLFVFAWLVVGGEETEVRLLAKHLDAARYRLAVLACFRRPNMPEQTHRQLGELGVAVDKTPYSLSFEDTVEHLLQVIPDFDLVVACQAVPDVYPGPGAARPVPAAVDRARRARRRGDHRPEASDQPIRRRLRVDS